MSNQHRVHLQVMSSEDRQFDDLLRRAAQRFQQVVINRRVELTSTQEAKLGDESRPN